MVFFIVSKLRIEPVLLSPLLFKVASENGNTLNEFFFKSFLKLPVILNLLVFSLLKLQNYFFNIIKIFYNLFKI